MCVCVCILPTVYTSSPVVRSGPNFADTCRSSPNGSELNKYQPRVTQGGFGGVFRGSEIQKSGITTKRVDQLAQNLVHACGLNWEWKLAKNN